MKRLVVVGEAADDLGIQCDGWTIDWQGCMGAVTHGGTTVLSAIRQAVSSDTQVIFSPDGSETKGADAIVAVVGELPYAEMKGDRKNLNLAINDLMLIKKVKATGAPVITILLSGRPPVLGRALDASDALIAAWLPGTEGQGVQTFCLAITNPPANCPAHGCWTTNNTHPI